MGYSGFVKMLGPMLSSDDLLFLPFKKGRWMTWVLVLAQADACYFIGGLWTDSRFFKVAHLFRKPVVIHWVGTDVLEVREAIKRGQVSHSLLKSSIHWAEVPWTAQELNNTGIPAEVVPLTSTITTARIAPLPKKLTVLVYFSDTRYEFYGAHHILRLAKEMPDIQILCVGLGSEGMPFHFTSDPIASNIKLLGRVDNLEKIYDESTVLIRMTKHDGLSFMVLEALAHGRYVIWSYLLDGSPGLFVASDYQTMFGYIQAMHRKHTQGDLLPNHEGAEFVQSHYSQARVAEEIRRRFQRIVGQ
jgi:glycosyltransferase involved in cell wall biosynthesis